MKAGIRLIALLAFLCMLPAAYASDVAGAWKGSFDVEGNSIPVTLNLKTAGAAITGTMDGLNPPGTEIHEGKIDGDAITFWLNSDYQGQTYKVVFKGKITGDTIDFSLGTDDGNWGTTMTMKRDAGPAAPASAPAGPDVTGAWKGAFDFNGNSVPLTFNFKTAGSAITGNVMGMGAAPVEIHDGKIDGNNVSFWVNTDYEGQTYAITYKGKITPGQIDFTFGTADGSWGSTVTVKKS